MKRRILSIVALLLMAATGAWAETITWDDTNVFKSENAGVEIGSELTSATYEGITITYNNVTHYSSLMLYSPV